MSWMLPALAGATLGAGVFLLVRAAVAPPPPLWKELARLETTTSRPAGPVPAGVSGLWARAVDTVTDRQPPTAGSDLQVCARTPEEHASQKLFGAVAGVIAVAGFGLLVAAGGGRLPGGFLIAAMVGAGAVGFVYPDLQLKRQASARRREFRYALSTYLDLVSVLLAGGTGLESALTTAADQGEGWPFSHIRTALRQARVTDRTPWEAFNQLADTLGVEELQRSVAVPVTLAGTHGARIRESLITSAEALRGRLMAEAEAAATGATVRMTIPVALLVIALILFIGFGVFSAIASPTHTVIP